MTKRLVYGFVPAAVVFFLPLLSRAADTAVWQMTPYKVQIMLAVEHRPPITPMLVQELKATLRERIDTTIGACWTAEITAPPTSLLGPMLHDFNGIKAADVEPPFPPPDKILLLAVTCAPDGLTVKARDFDVQTHILSAPVTRKVGQIGVLGDATFDALLAAFAPISRIESANKRKREVVVRPKAAGLPPRDPNLFFIRKGDVLQPIHRFNDREGNLKNAAPIAWNFLTAEQINSDKTLCKLHSGVTAAITKRGRRVESLALKVIPTQDQTVITLRARTKPHDPLFGYKVYSRDPYADKVQITFLGRTDRRGRFVIPPSDQILRIILIKNGREPIARMPLVPGLEPEMTTEIANDDLRLWAEGFIYSLQEEMVDIVARRKIYDVLIHARINSGDLKEADILLEEMKLLPSSELLIDRLQMERDRFATTDHVVQKKIDLFLNDTNSLIHQHLGPRSIAVLEEELRDAKISRAKREEEARLEAEKEKAEKEAQKKAEEEAKKKAEEEKKKKNSAD